MRSHAHFAMARQHACAPRMKKELITLQREPPHGISCWPVIEDRLDRWEAKILGGHDTAFKGGVFKLEIIIPERYPFEPPKVRFLTPIYHPNIDDKGRICLDVLKMPPQGSWKPSQSISTVLLSIQLLLAEPNPDDGLMQDISVQYKYNRPQFIETAEQWVEKYAKNECEESRKRVADNIDHSDNNLRPKMSKKE